MFCGKCGRNIDDREKKCPYCGNEIYGNVTLIYESKNDYENEDDSEFIDDTTFDSERKSIVVAGLLQIFLGVFGIGRFYLGYRKMAAFQLAVSLFTFLVGGVIWGFIDGIMILSGKVIHDANGRELSK